MSRETSAAGFREQNWGDAYQRYRPLLLRALAGLARSGFIVAPDEGLDLIQDFFVEAWHGLVQRYDPERARPETYVFRAFTQFARRRILRARRRAEMLADVARVARASGRESREPDPQAALVDAIRSALAALPPPQSAILHAYLAAPVSERALARRFNITRYRAREMLIAAISRVTEAIRTEGLVPEPVRRAAVPHWREGIPPEQTARMLGIPPADVRSSRTRLLYQLARHVPRHRPERADAWNRGDSMMDVESLLRRLLSSPGGQGLLDEARRRSAELVEYLQRNEFAWDEVSLRVLEQHPQWAGDVFDALAGEVPLAAEDQAALDELVAIKEEDDRSIGQIFRNGLMRDLEPQLQDWTYWLEGLPNISEEDRQYLERQPDVAAAAPAADPLLRYGVTPLTIFYATLAVKVAVDRLMSAGAIAGNDVFLLTADPDRTRDEHDVDVLPAEDVAAEIVSMSEVSPNVARALLRWLVAVAQLRSFLFPEFEAFPEGRDVRLKRVDGNMTLQARWSRELVPA